VKRDIVRARFRVTALCTRSFLGLTRIACVVLHSIAGEGFVIAGDP
jgi:hypothetical protein